MLTHPADHLQAGPHASSSSSPQLKAIISFPSPLSHSLIWERWNRFFQLGGIVESVCFRLPHCCCSLPPLRSSRRLACPHPIPAPSPLSQHSRGGSGKRWVTFKHFHPFHSAADLFVPASEVLIGGEELSLAWNQDFSPGWCTFGFLTRLFCTANPLCDWLVFLRTLLTYLTI